MCDAQLPQGASCLHPVCIQVFGVEELVSAAQRRVPCSSGSWVGGALLPRLSLKRLLKGTREKEMH